MIQLWKIVFYESKQSEFIEETMMDKKTQKIGVICSIVQIILSIICLIYNAINQENIIIWVLFLCSGILLLSSNIIKKKTSEEVQIPICMSLLFHNDTIPPLLQTA